MIAGDSWSSGSIGPTVDGLANWGHPGVVVTSSGTAIAGSQASEWVANHNGKLDTLADALDGAPIGQPPADVLLIYLGGNDFNFALNQGLGPFPDLAMALLLDQVEGDLEALVQFATAGRPGLDVVLVGYSYLHFEWFTTLFGLSLDVNDTADHNEHFTELEGRKLAIAGRNPGVHYVHNLGLLQHHLGLVAAPPWSLPLVDYPPGFFDAPSGPPGYAPFPGGTRDASIDPNIIPPWSLPGPTAGFVDGIHPSDVGWYLLVENVCDQGLCNLLDGLAWP